MANNNNNNLRRLLPLLNYTMILLLWGGGSAKPPPSPVQCNSTGCILYNSYGVWGDRKNCQATTIIYPTTEEELRLAVANASKNQLKVKVVTKFSHSIPKWACPAAGGGAMLISTDKYDSTVEVDAQSRTVTADAGVGLRKLIDKVEEAGLSLVAAPYWEGVTVGGVISTGGHGSSWWGRGGAVHDHVAGISLVVPAKRSQGYARIIRLEPHDPLFNAAKLSLGLLGVISKVTLWVEKGFKRSISYNFTDDGEIENEFMDHANKHEFADITWYPSTHAAVYRYDVRVPLDTSGDGVNDFLGFQPNPAFISHSLRAAEKSFESSRNVKGKCIAAASFLAYKKLTANGLKNNNLIFTGYPVIGRQGKMQTSGSCLYSPATSVDDACAWDPRIKGLFFYETTAIFPSASSFRDFIFDVKKLRNLTSPDNFCGVDMYNGFLVRFIKSSEAYLGQSEDSVVVDFNYFRSDDASSPRLNQDVWEEVEQMAFFRYGARPHWAKNRDLAFLNVEKKYVNFGKFLAAKKETDPGNMFSGEWSDRVFMFVGNNKEKEGGGDDDGCALEGMCVCTEDRHCSPGKGYYCQPGVVYKEARVCRHSSPSSSFNQLVI